MMYGNNQSWCAKTALQGVVLDERLLLHTRVGQVGQALHRAHLGAVGLHGECEAAAHDAPVHLDRAGAAHAVLATQVRAFEAEFVAQHVDQVQARGNGAAVWLAVDMESDGVKV